MLHKNSLSYSLSGRKWSGQNLTMNLIYDLPIYQSLTTDYNMQEVLLPTEMFPNYQDIHKLSLFLICSLSTVSAVLVAIHF